MVVTSFLCAFAALKTAPPTLPAFPPRHPLQTESHSQSQPTPTITFKASFLKLEEVVRQLSAKSGLKLTVSGAVKNYPLYLNVKEAPVADVLTKVAEATGAQWDTDNDARTLSCPIALKRQQDKTPNPRIVKAIRSAFAEAGKRATRFPTLTENLIKSGAEESAAGYKKLKEYQQIHGAISYRDYPKELVQLSDSYSPTFRCAIKLLNALGPEKIASLSDDSRIVFSTRPTQMQETMPLAGAQAFSQFLVEERLSSNVRDGFSRMRNVDGAFCGPDTYPGFFEGSLSSGSPGIPGVQTLILSTEESGENISVELNQYNTLGKLVASGQTALRFQPESGVVDPQLGQKTPLSLTPLSIQFALESNRALQTDLFQYSRNIEAIPKERLRPSPLNSTSPSLSNQVRETLRNCCAQEIWNLIAPPFLDPLAKNTNVVALIPDSLVCNAVAEIARANGTCEGALQSLAKSTSLHVTHQDGWLVLRPESFTDYRDSFVRREALAKLLNRAATAGVVSLEDLANFVTQHPGSRGVTSLGTLALYLVGKVTGLDIDGVRLLSPRNVKELKFYGYLSSTLKNHLLAGGKISPLNLNTEAAEVLAQMTFSSLSPASYEEDYDEDSSQDADV